MYRMCLLFMYVSVIHTLFIYFYKCEFIISSSSYQWNDERQIKIRL